MLHIRKEIGSQYGEADGYFVTGQIIGKNRCKFILFEESFSGTWSVVM